MSFTQTLWIIVLPQAFRAVIGPLGSVLIALIKNTTIAAAIGVPEAFYTMRNQLQNYGDIVIPIFAGYACSSLRSPCRRGCSSAGWPSAGGWSGEPATTVLYDVPGPRGRRRNRLLTVIFAVAFAAIVAVVVWKLGQKNQWTAQKWKPFRRGDIWTGQIIPGVEGTLKAAAIAAVLALLFGIAFGIARISDHWWISLAGRNGRRILPGDPAAVADLLRLVCTRRGRRTSPGIRARCRQWSSG